MVEPIWAQAPSSEHGRARGIGGGPRSSSVFWSPCSFLAAPAPASGRLRGGAAWCLIGAQPEPQEARARLCPTGD